MKKLVPETIRELDKFRMEIGDEFTIPNPNDRHNEYLISKDMASLDMEAIKHMPWHHDYFL